MGALTTAGERLAAFSAHLQLESIPSGVVDAAKLHLLDAVGCGLAAHALEIGQAGREIAPPTAPAEGASVIGSELRSAPANAALANGMLCHALDFDDTHSGSICHVSVVTAPVATAIAEARGLAGSQLLAALIAGNEVTIRVGEAVAPGYMVRGFHPTSVCGIFGATATAARLLSLDVDTTASAFGIAGSMVSGLFAYLGDGSATKPVHAGWAAHAGIIAAELAAAGQEGPVSIFEDRYGFCAAYFGTDARALAEQLDDLGSRWETPRIAFKPYPACHFVHSCIDAAASLLAERPIAADDVARVKVAIPAPGIPLVLEPTAAKRDPRTDYEGKFSLQFVIAALLVQGRVDVSTFGPATIRDPEVLSVTHKIDYEQREFPTYPQSFPGWVRIELHDGSTLERELSHQRGGADNPMSREDVVLKYQGNATLALDSHAASDLSARIMALESVGDVTDAFAEIRAASRQVLAGAPTSA